MSFVAEHTTSLAAADPLIRVQDVVKAYPDQSRSTLAVDRVSLDVMPGEFVSIVGPSGCGKSTLMMMVSGLVPYTGGEIRIGGTRVATPYTDVGIVFQRDALLEWRTILDNVLLQIDVRRLKRPRLSRQGARTPRPRGPRQFRERLSARALGRDATARLHVPRARS